MRDTQKRRFVLILLLAVASGCGRQLPEQTPKATPKRQQQIIGVSLADCDSPRGAQMRADIEAAAAEHADVRFLILDAEGDTAKQKSQLAELAANRVGVVIVCPTNAQDIVDPVAALLDAGKFVVVLDKPIVGQKYTCFVAADPKQIGFAAGKWMAERLQGKGKLVELKGPVDSRWDQELHTAWRAALRDPGYRFVFQQHVDPGRVDAEKLMGEALEQIEDIDAVFAYSDDAAAAAHEVAKAADRSDGVLFVGVGEATSGGQVEESAKELDAVFMNPTGGKEAVAAAIDLLAGRNVSKTITPDTSIMTGKEVE